MFREMQRLLGMCVVSTREMSVTLEVTKGLRATVEHINALLQQEKTNNQKPISVTLESGEHVKITDVQELTTVLKAVHRDLDKVPLKPK